MSNDELPIDMNGNIPGEPVGPETKAMRGLNPTPDDHYARALYAGPHVADLPPEDTEFDCWGGFDGSDIYTNNYEGSCVECEQENWFAGMNNVNGLRVRFDKSVVHSAYRTQSGGRDSGLDLGTSLDWHAKNPVRDTAGHDHIGGPHGSLACGNRRSGVVMTPDQMAVMSKGCFYFRGLKIGVASGQLDGTKPGQILTGLRRSTALDHCIAAVGRKLIGGARYWQVETWGYYLYLDEASFANITWESWVRSMEPDRFLPTGKTIEGWPIDEVTKLWNVFSGAA